MRFLSLCSGIEAASVAWAPLGWKAVAFAEIEAFPSAVLAHHYPDVPNLGDITRFKEWPDLGPVNVVCGGTPCQSFSIAGLRKGLADPRGNLSLTFLAIVDRYRPRYVIWENVPGVLSDDGGRSFASIVGGLGQLGYGWAYRVLDAQYVRVDGLGRAVPQRRRRVVVVGYLGDWRRAAAVLSEPESVLGNTPPRREAGQGTAAGAQVGFGGGRTSGAVDVAARLAANGVRQDLEVETFVACPVADSLTVGANQTFGFSEDVIASRAVAATLTRGAESAGKGGYAGRRQEDDENLVAHSLRAEGFDASEDGTGRGTPLVPVAYSIMPQNSGKDYKAREVDVAQPLMAGGPVGGNQGGDYLLQPIPIDMRQASRGETMTNNRPEGTSGGAPGTGIGEAGDPSPTIASSHVPAVAFDMRGREGGSQFEGPHQTANIRAASGGSSRSYVAESWAVRRLMPVECERLMGFPDGYTAISYRGKPAADGPRYKALGNSWAVNVFRWVGRRIEMVEQLAAELQMEVAA